MRRIPRRWRAGPAPRRQHGNELGGSPSRTTRTGLKGLVASGAIVKSLLWLATVVVSAVVGLIIKGYWDAPRPVVELSAVQMRSVGSTTGVVAIPLDLRGTIERHSWIPDINERATASDVSDALDKAETGDAEAGHLVKVIDELIDLLKTRPTSLSVDVRRREFLQKWITATGNALEVRTKLALDRSELPAKYRATRASGYTEEVDLGPSTMNLREVDEQELARSESAVRGPVNVYDQVLRDARRTNLLRRWWSYMEPEVMLPILENVKALVQSDLALSKTIAGQLRDALRLAQPEHIVVDVVVTNRGGAPLPIRHLAVLTLEVPSKSGGPPDRVQVDLRSSASKGVTVVAPGSVDVVTLESAKSVTELVRSHEALRGPAGEADSSRLRGLFENGGAQGRVALARAGVEPESSLAAVTAARPIGGRGDTLILDALKR